MGTREFIASLVNSLAWPASVAVIACLFRRQLAALLDGRVKRWKAGPLEVEYWAEETADVIDNVGVDAVAASVEDQDDELAHLTELATKTPVVAVVAGFRLVEREVRRIARNAGVDAADGTPLNKLLLLEAEAGLITPETLSAVRGLSTLRNLAAHDDGSGLSVTPERAREYVVLVQAVLFALSRPPRSHAEAAMKSPGEMPRGSSAYIP